MIARNAASVIASRENHSQSSPMRRNSARNQSRSGFSTCRSDSADPIAPAVAPGR